MKYINQIVILLSLFISCLSHTMLPPLHKAAFDGNLEQVQQLLDEGADVDAALPTVLERKTTLHLAAYKGHKDLVMLLLERKANPNATDWRNRTPLHFAVEDYKNRDIVNLLLKGGANPNLSDSCGYRSLAWALRQSYPSLSIVALLVNRGAYVNVAANDGSTPFHWAALHGSSHLMDLLLREGADPKVADKNGSTPLHWAAQKDNVIAVYFLINKAGADINAVDNDGRRPLNIAQSFERSEVEKYLILEERKKSIYAFLMATHSRLGAESPANVFPKELFQHIWKFVKPNIKEADEADIEVKLSKTHLVHEFELLLKRLIK